MAELNTLYKLIILKMLDTIDAPLTNTQLTDFFLQKEYTDYFTVQQVINDLIHSELIRFETTHSNTQYLITTPGKETLHYFQEKISDSIVQDIHDYFAEKKMELKSENSLLANYYKTSNGYDVHCQSREHNQTVLDITISVKNREQAETICHNWSNTSEDLYAVLMDTLLR